MTDVAEKLAATRRPDAIALERAAALISEALELLGAGAKVRTQVRSMTPAQFAAAAGFSEKTIQRRQADGEAVRVGSVWYSAAKNGGRWEWAPVNAAPRP